MTLEAQRTGATIDATQLAAIEERVARGDRDAFAELADLLTPHVHAVLVGSAGPHRADELTIALLVDAWRLAPRLRHRGASIAAWVLAQSERLATATRPTLA